MTLRPILLLLTLLLTALASARGADPADYTAEAVEARLRRMGPRPAEGIWLLTAGAPQQALIAIERDESSDLDAGSYTITVVEAADRALLPGTVIGHARATADPDIFDAEIARDIAGGIASATARYTLRLTADGDRLALEQRRSKLRVNLYAALPYLFIRPSISSRSGSNTEAPAAGAVRVFPRPSRPAQPVYL